MAAGVRVGEVVVSAAVGDGFVAGCCSWWSRLAAAGVRVGELVVPAAVVGALAGEVAVAEGLKGVVAWQACLV